MFLFILFTILFFIVAAYIYTYSSKGIKVGKYEHVETGPFDPFELTSVELQVLVLTWNLNNTPPTSDLESFLKAYQDYDLIIIGTQEAHLNRKKGLHFFDRIESLFGSTHATISKRSLKDAIELIILAKSSHISRIHNVQVDDFSTTIPVILKKGGVGISFRYGNRSFCFVNVHLSAHTSNLSLRLLETENTLRKLNLGNHNFDISNQFDHIFFFGDLNHRIDGIYYKDMKQFQENNSFEDMTLHDQLHNAQKNNKTLIFFKEAPINFLPTFKKIRGYYDRFITKRNPSWCDRILYNSIEGYEKFLKLKEYNDVKTLISSDHSAVYATFNVIIEEGRNSIEPSSEYELIFSQWKLQLYNQHVPTGENSMLRIIFNGNIAQQGFQQSEAFVVGQQSMELHVTTIPLNSSASLTYQFTSMLAIYRCMEGKEQLVGLISFNISPYILEDHKTTIELPIVSAGIQVGNAIFDLQCKKKKG